MFSLMDPIIINPGGVSKVINWLKLSSATGANEINSKCLKSANPYSSLILASMFQQSLDTGSLPNDRKISKIIPLQKAGGKHFPFK